MSGATSEDVTLATRWVLERMERNQDERRQWHEAAMALSREGTASHNARFSRLVVAALLRPLIELAILIVLLVKL